LDARISSTFPYCNNSIAFLDRAEYILQRNERLQHC
jgi:hypothetical protein